MPYAPRHLDLYSGKRPTVTCTLTRQRVIRFAYLCPCMTLESPDAAHGPNLKTSWLAASRSLRNCHCSRDAALSFSGYSASSSGNGSCERSRASR